MPAVTDAYATAITYRALVPKVSAAQDTVILDDLVAISRYLDRRLGRFFTVDAAVVVRTYAVRSFYTRTVFVDDISSTTGLIVKVDDNRDGVAETTLTIVTDFELFPRNADKGPEPAPFTQLYLPNRATRNYWPEVVEVTAKFGWPAVPKAIERATCHLTGILRIESPRATIRVAEAVDEVMEASPAAQQILSQLMNAYAKPAWVYSNA